MERVMNFLFRTNGQGGRLDLTDWITYIYLGIGTIVMFGPVLWLLMSSFKTEAEIRNFPPRILPYRQETMTVPGYDEPLPLFDVPIFEVMMADGTTALSAAALPREQDDGSILYRAILLDGERAEGVSVEQVELRRMAQVRAAQMIDPEDPQAPPITASLTDRIPVEYVFFSVDNYTRALQSNNFDFWRYLFNSVFVTTMATLLTLLINSMAAFALSKYQFPGRNAIFLVIISTLMVPLSVILVPAFLLITQLGWNNNLIGIIVPTIATPTGVFLLRQYMLTIPDELIDSARIDGASEWRIYQQIIVPLAAPALAVLAIFSVMWRWNDFLWPKIVLTQSEMFTLQVALESFQGTETILWDLTLAMTVLTALPITFVFAFLQRYITTGIATTGMK